MSVTIHKLESKTFSKKCKIEISKILIDAKSFKKKNVPGCGKVVYIFDKKGDSIAHCFNDIGYLTLSVK